MATYIKLYVPWCAYVLLHYIYKTHCAWHQHSQATYIYVYIYIYIYICICSPLHIYVINTYIHISVPLYIYLFPFTYICDLHNTSKTLLRVAWNLVPLKTHIYIYLFPFTYICSPLHIYVIFITQVRPYCVWREIWCPLKLELGPWQHPRARPLWVSPYANCDLWKVYTWVCVCIYL